VHDSASSDHALMLSKSSFGYYVALPTLLFASSTSIQLCKPQLIVRSQVVPSFNSENIAAMGPLFASSLIYMIVGACFGFVIREITYVVSYLLRLSIF
jgi:hypothetical protein